MGFLEPTGTHCVQPASRVAGLAGGGPWGMGQFPQPAACGLDGPWACLVSSQQQLSRMGLWSCSLSE